MHTSELHNDIGPLEILIMLVVGKEELSNSTYMMSDNGIIPSTKYGISIIV